MNPKALVFSHYFPPAHQAGGPIKSLEAMLQKALALDTIAVLASAQDLDGTPLEGIESNKWTSYNGVAARYSTSQSRIAIAALSATTKNPDVVYVNSFFDPLFGLLPALLHKLGAWPGATFALAPRGELSSGALSQKSLKKQAALRLTRRLGLHSDVLWHASTAEEATDIRRSFSGANVFVQPNDVLLKSALPTRINNTVRHITFIGRLSPVKGLHVLIEALTEYTEPRPLHLDIFGSNRDDEIDYADSCRQAAEHLPATVTATFHGPMPHEAILDHLHNKADLLALPTAGENFGHAIVEALANGCPVMIPPTTIWSGSANATGTLVDDLTPRSWTVKIEQLAQATDAELSSMREIAANQFMDWQTKNSERTTILDRLIARREAPSVAIVTQGYRSSGGVQTVARWLRESLIESGFEVTVYDLASSSRDAHSRRLAKPRTWFAAPRIHWSDSEPGLAHIGANAVEIEPFRYFPRRSLTKELAKHDLVQVVAGGPALAFSAKRCGKPVILQMATSVTWERTSIIDRRTGLSRTWLKLMTLIVSQIEKLALRSSSAILVENPDALSLVRATAPKIAAAIAPPGIDTDLFYQEATGWNATGPIVSVGRLNEPRKGWSRMLHAYRHLQDTMSGAPPLILIGRGTKDDLSAEVSALGLAEDVTIQNDLDLGTLRRTLRTASVFWQTSHEEGLGIAVLEAMASGIPVVATATSGTTMTVRHGETGYLVSQNDELLPDEITTATVEILTNTGPAMADSARLRATTVFSTHTTFRHFKRTYSQFIGA